MTDNPALRAATEYIIATQLFPGDEKYDNHLARGLAQGMLSAVANSPDARFEIGDAAYEAYRGYPANDVRDEGLAFVMADAVLRVIGGSGE